MGKTNLRGLINLTLCLLGICFFLPYAYWSNYRDYQNIKARGKQIKCRVISVKGLKGTRIGIRYRISGKTFEKVVTAPSLHKPIKGDSLTLLYDTLDYENIKVIW